MEKRRHYKKELSKKGTGFIDFANHGNTHDKER